jgi:biopolymer transport protein ExbD
MLKQVGFCLLILILCTPLLYSHGDPIMGTVTALNGDKLAIRDRNNKPVEIMLEKATQYFVNDKPARKTDLKAGVRVVIDAHMDSKIKMLAAEEVNIAPPTAANKK